MIENYLVYPFKTMRITQSYSGLTSHRPHSIGTPKDYPIDEGGKDSGRDGFYCPCDELKIVRIYGIGSKGVNSIWVESLSKVKFSDGSSDYVSGQITHSNDSDLKRLKVGQIFKRGQLICYEGTDGATSNHLHISFGKGKIKGTGWTLNSNSKWVLTTTKGACKPENLFYIDPSFTKVVNNKGLKFKTLPENKNQNIQSVSKDEKYIPGKYKITKANVLKVRKGASTTYEAKKYSELSSKARSEIVKLSGYKANGYVKGMIISVSIIKGNFGKTSSGWICLDYCERIVK